MKGAATLVVSEVRVKVVILAPAPVALYEREDGLVSPRLLVIEIDFNPVLAGVYVKVAVVIVLLRVTEFGENEPPPVAAGVMVTELLRVPLALTMKTLDGTLTRPEVGPVRVRAVAPPEGAGGVGVLEPPPPPPPPPPLLFFTKTVKEAMAVPLSPVQLMLYEVVVANLGVV